MQYRFCSICYSALCAFLVSLCIFDRRSVRVMIFISSSAMSFVTNICAGECPNGCSGRGECMTMRDISIYHGPDYDTSQENVGDGKGVNYDNWDADAIMMCRCSYGYFGPDCSLGNSNVCIR